MEERKPTRRLKVGELARLTGKTQRTIRYYEELGLLTPADHSRGGFRLFDPQQAARVTEISRLQEAGFSLDRIAQIVKTWKQSPRGADAARDLKQVLEFGIAEAAKRIQEMVALKQEIEESLLYLDECGRCNDEPSRDRCGCCTKGVHGGALPLFFDKLMD